LRLEVRARVRDRVRVRARVRVRVRVRVRARVRVRVRVRAGGSVPMQSNHGEWVNILANTCMKNKTVCFQLVVSE